MSRQNTKYHIISSIENDAPTSGVNWCTISFLTPQNIEKTKYLDAKGFKVYDGYNTEELAKDDAKNIKEHNKNHDVYISQIGKIYAWDDSTKTEQIEYEDQKLNDLEKTKKENDDKIKLMKEQFKNEYTTTQATNTEKTKAEELRQKYQKKLYEKGLITKQEYDLMMDENKPGKDVKEIVLQLEKIKDEVEEAYQTDYLDETKPTGLKYGCMSIYSPKHIGGLKTLIFKVRGLYQTPAELARRIKKLQTLYPNDRIYQFEIGKWCVFSEKDGIDTTILLKQLNYSMKCYLEKMELQTKEFEERKQSLVDKTKKEANTIKKLNRNQRRKEKREAKKARTENVDTRDTNIPTVQKSESITSLDSLTSMGDETDDAHIQQIFNFLDDPELRDKYAATATDCTTQTVEI